MATTPSVNAYSIFTSTGANDQLKVVYASIIDQIQRMSLSVQLKNTDLSGNPLAGSVVVRRLQTAGVQAYGTARTAGAGNKIKNNGVTVNLDQRQEIVEEVNKMDLLQYGLAGIVERRGAGFALKLSSYLDTAFFNLAVSAGTQVNTYTSTLNVADRLEVLIQSLETVKNNNVDGVDRSMISVTLSPDAYGQLRTYIDKLPNPSDGGVLTPTFHGVKVFSNTRQTVQAIAQVEGSIAQPVAIIDFATGDIPLSADLAMQLFFNYGTYAVMPDLIKYSTDIDVSS